MTLFKNWGFPGRRTMGRTHGFSLLEILIVITIMVGLMALVATNLSDKADQAKEGQTQIAMTNLSQALQYYRVHNNRYPTTEQGLQALLTAPPDVKTWHGPYVDNEDKLLDAWKQPYQYTSDGRTFKIVSSGRSQQFGNADNIVYPAEDNSDAAKTGGS